MKLKLIFFSFLSLLIISCNTAVDNSDSSAKIKALEEKMNADSKTVNAKLNNLESSLKKLEKSVANLSKNNNQKQPSKPSGPWKRDYTYKTSVGDSYYQGPKDAKVVITEWSDYY